MFDLRNRVVCNVEIQRAQIINERLTNSNGIGDYSTRGHIILSCSFSLSIDYLFNQME